MKTSLIIEDELFESAKREALKSGKTLSEVISTWARKGRDIMRRKSPPKNKFKPVDLGSDAQVDLTKRSEWMEDLSE